MLTSPQIVIAEFGRLTGINFRSAILPYDVEQQALTFAKHFELWELRLVVEWTRAKIHAGEEKRNGFSELSLQWHRLIAERGDDRLTQFQQRLGLAMTWAKKTRPSLIPREERTVEEPASKPRGRIDELPNVDPDKVTELRKKLMGGAP